MFYAEVLVNKKIKSLDHTFVYEIPPHLVDAVRIGTAVSVPFGHGTTEGLVVGFAQTAGMYEAKYIDDVINGAFLFPKDLLELAAYIADYYMNSTISVLKAMTPKGINPFGKIQKEKTAVLLRLKENLEEVSFRGKQQRELYQLLLDKKELWQKEAKEDYGFSPSVIKGLEEKNLIEKEEVVVNRYSYLKDTPIKTLPPSLTAAQKSVLSEIKEKNDGKPFLLHGVTGSGKTEIYMALAESMLRAGKQCIILLPEIALTPQFVQLFENRFPHQVVLMHSRLSEGERRDAWYDARSGKAKVVLGPRSAVFAPVEHLGLIVMDEEHEDSYEQSTSPRFHCREVAKKRCEMQNGIFLMGSATPSFESYQKALSGEYHLLMLAQRIDERPLPRVDIVDMRKELREGWTEVLSRPLLRLMEDALARKEQVMLFLNRLGANTFVSCRDCGFVYECPHCGISMVYYKSKNRMRCNRCGYEIPMEKLCPQCGSERIRYFGMGTEGLEKVVRSHFPFATIDRMDSDATRLKGQFETIFQRMKNGTTDILIGTKMMSKGWDFPKVTVMGIVAADLTLNFPDFRAAEETFQSITQVAGRCGRGENTGHVILQTYRPEEKVLALAAEQNYQAYFAWEKEKRKSYGYPPFSEMMKVVFSTKRGFFQETDIAEIKKSFSLAAKDNCIVLGPVPPMYRYEREWEKWVITLMGQDISFMKEVIKEGFQGIRRELLNVKDVKIHTEINPRHIL